MEERPSEDPVRQRSSVSKERTVRRNQTHPELGLVASRTGEINLCSVSHPVCDSLLWQP